MVTRFIFSPSLDLGTDFYFKGEVNMKDTLERIRTCAKELADSCSELKTLDDIRVRF